MIGWTLDARIATLTLDRPAARNAIPIAGWHALASALAEIAASDARALILRSAAPGIFSAGADITEFAALQADPSAAARFREAMRAAIDTLAALPIPTIAAIDGGCYGAAVALTLACDIRVAGAHARIATTPAKLGIGYPGEDVARLIAQVGRGQASRMLFSAQPIDADEAARIGLVEILAPDAGKAAAALAAQIAVNAPGAVAMLKRTLADPRDSAHDAAFDDAFAGSEFAAAFVAFKSGKTP
ncbi:enoyl-CoA hydratase/isomerase family protein [Sphingomonas koreensis]|nr:enoyl-CoA hydratase/isomerase family protein [Sphingomonas koreensis]